MDFQKHAIGCISGAIIGDACGSSVKFKEKSLNSIELDRCMDLRGGGHLKLNPGQCSDEGEMIMCLMQTLAEMGEGDDTFDQSIVVKWYKRWFDSDPLDIESAIANTIGKLSDVADPRQAIELAK